jgi:hypothetical protein
MWRKYIKEKQGDKNTREFLMNNIRNARWLIESIQQRKSTITESSARSSTPSASSSTRAGASQAPAHDQRRRPARHPRRNRLARVSEKWIQTPRGVFPLRRFFSGGTTSAEGEEMSWDAVKEKLKAIIDNEDKKNPLNDDEIVDKLKDRASSWRGEPSRNTAKSSTSPPHANAKRSSMNSFTTQSHDEHEVVVLSVYIRYRPQLRMWSKSNRCRAIFVAWWLIRLFFEQLRIPRQEFLHSDPPKREPPARRYIPRIEPTPPVPCAYPRGRFAPVNTS